MFKPQIYNVQNLQVLATLFNQKIQQKKQNVLFI